MRRALVAVGIVTAALLFSSAAFAATTPWTLPNNVRIVQKTGGGGTNVYGTIQAALASITNASANNPYLVSVMSGTYNEVVTLKPYVYLEGSGPENTIISASVAGNGYSTCTYGTVVMDNNSSIRNVKIVNIPPAQNGGTNTTAALVFNNVSAKAEDIIVSAGIDTRDGGRLSGVCAMGAAANVVLNNVTVETHNNGSQSIAVMIFSDANLTLTNSKLSSFSSHGPIDIIDIPNDDGNNSGSAILTVNNTALTGTNTGTDDVYGMWMGGYNVSVTNSVITMHTSARATPFEAQENTIFSMANSQFISGSPVVFWPRTDCTVKIANSLIPTGYSTLQNLSNVKFVNDYDENFNPITNQ
jgi:hypothetical protein